jgi:hypothetical protein
MALPAAAQQAVVYPLASAGATESETASAEELLKTALLRLRWRELQVDVPATKPTCGPVAKATVKCLAALSKGGVVFRGLLRKAPPVLALSISAVDAAGKVFGPVRADIHPGVDDLGPISEALQALDDLMNAAAPRPAAVPASAQLPVPTAAIAGEPPPPAPWMETYGKWGALGGVGLMALSGVTGFLGSKLNDDLNAKYAAQGLSAADRGSVDSLHRYAVMTNVLLVGGAVVTLAGLTLWGLAPDTGSAVGLRRNF